MQFPACMSASSSYEKWCRLMPQREKSPASTRGIAMSAALHLGSLALFAQAAASSALAGDLSTGFRFAEKSGQQLYENVCQACHMPDGKGATGAGSYPSLAGNDRLGTSGYPIALILDGQRAMPPFALMMSDEQVAAVVNHVRKHFDNHFQDAVTVEDVRAARRGKIR
jgi:mono/diheme cytochrome c family protein